MSFDATSRAEGSNYTFAKHSLVVPATCYCPAHDKSGTNIIRYNEVVVQGNTDDQTVYLHDRENAACFQNNATYILCGDDVGAVPAQEISQSCYGKTAFLLDESTHLSHGYFAPPSELQSKTSCLSCGTRLGQPNQVFHIRSSTMGSDLVCNKEDCLTKAGLGSDKVKESMSSALIPLSGIWAEYDSSDGTVPVPLSPSRYLTGLKKRYADLKAAGKLYVPALQISSG